MLRPPQDLSGFIRVFKVSICFCTLLSLSLGDKQLQINYITRVITLSWGWIIPLHSGYPKCCYARCRNGVKIAGKDGWIWGLSSAITLYFPMMYYALYYSRRGKTFFFPSINCHSHFFCGVFFFLCVHKLKLVQLWILWCTDLLNHYKSLRGFF